MNTPSTRAHASAIARSGGPTRRVVVGLACGLWLTLAAAQPIQLLSPDEVRRYAGDPSEPLLLPRVAGAPVIDVLKPAIPSDGKLTMPVPIEVSFRAGADARVDPSSFKVLYGALKFDVTERLLKAVKVEPAGLRVEQVQIPSGSHRLILQIADTQGRVGTRELRFSVE